MLDIEDSPWLMPGKAFSLRLAQCEPSKKNCLLMNEINAALIVGLLRLWSASVYAFACGSTRSPTANRGFSWGLSDQALKRVLASLGLKFGIVLLSGLFYIRLHPIAFSHYSPSKTADQGYQEDSNKKDVIGHSRCRKFQ